jgi:hypothetical protein
MPPATPANAARPGAPTATTPLLLLATATRPLPPLTTTPLVWLATARTRRFTLVIGPPDFLHDPPGPLFFDPPGPLFFTARLALEALLLDAGLALEAFTPLLRTEVLRERPVVEPTLRRLPRDRFSRSALSSSGPFVPPKNEMPCSFAIPQRSSRAN